MGMDHVIPPVPKWIRVVRYIELVVALLYLGMIAGALALISPFVQEGDSMGIFAGAFSLAGSLGVIITTTCAQGGYLKWFHLAWEALATLFWLIALGTTSVLASFWADASHIANAVGISEDDKSVNLEYDLVAGAAFLAGVQWVFFMLTLIFFSIGCHHYRMGRLDEDGKLMKGMNASHKLEMDNVPVSSHSGEHYHGTHPIAQPAMAPQYGAPAAGDYYVPPSSTIPQPQSTQLPAGLA